MSDQAKVRIWDLPVRIFHWCLAILVGICIYTGNTGGFKEMDYHMLSGYAILALVLFRVVWGFAGSRHARFSSFVRPGQVVGYSRSLFSDRYTPAPGHNPLGALSVIAMLVCVAVQASTGLFANDDIFLEGPLAHLVEDDTSDQLSAIHNINAKVLYGLLGLHLAAVIFHEGWHRERLTWAMITGRKKGFAAETAKPLQEVITAVVAIAAAGGFVYYLVNYL